MCELKDLVSQNHPLIETTFVVHKSLSNSTQWNLKFSTFVSNSFSFSFFQKQIFTFNGFNFEHFHINIIPLTLALCKRLSIRWLSWQYIRQWNQTKRKSLTVEPMLTFSCQCLGYHSSLLSQQSPTSQEHK